MKEKNIPLVKVDCTEEGDLCQNYGVEGYPTLMYVDGDSRLAGREMQEFAQNHGIKVSIGAAGHHETQGLVERTQGLLNLVKKKDVTFKEKKSLDVLH